MELLRFVKPYRKQFTLGSLAKLAEAMLELTLPILMARIIDIGIPTADRGYIVRTGALLLVFALAGFACACVCQYFAAVTSQGSGTLIRNALIEKISTLSYRELDQLGTSTLITRVTSDVNYVQQAVAMTMRLVTRAPFICIGAVIMSIGINPRLSIIFAVLIPILGLILYYLMYRTAPLYRQVQQKLDAFAGVVRENLTGVRVIRAFAKSDRERERAEKAAGELSDSFIEVAGLSALMNPATSIVLNLGIIAVLFFGARFVFDGQLPQGDLLALTTYATKILYALIVIANLVVLFTKASASSTRIGEVLATEPSVTDHVSPNLTPVRGAPCIAFEDVSFSYNGEENALSNINLRVNRGEMLGIVGVTGSGKTTLINLLQRFYDVADGDVKLYGLSVKNYPQQALRQIIGVVPQRNTLFSGSILDNLRWGKEDASEEEAVAALKTAQCWDFVSLLPKGIHSPVREGGKNFSGGQRQRLTIARAIIKQPAVLILDDSLSALDYKTDLNLRRALAENLKNTTVLIVSQRISSVAGADRIIVLDDGKLDGMGTHNMLLKSCRTYREIYASQSDVTRQDKDGPRLNYKDPRSLLREETPGPGAFQPPPSFKAVAQTLELTKESKSEANATPAPETDDGEDAISTEPDQMPESLIPGGDGDE